ncbi:RpiB/LacA/LacB family sugar-phosphate isomerase [Patescibacteria group bacterium]|nr:RpiB/LacA/LacB family sugar-phosphate isomerase [Patescibacteria group bacterium]
MIYLGSDHAGYEYKEEVQKYLLAQGYETKDLGAYNNQSSHYPQFAKKVTRAVQADSGNFGILFCRSGQGMAIAANREKKIRASVAWNEKVACEARNDNDSNVLSVPTGYVSIEQTKKIIVAFLSTNASKEPRHLKRITMLN